MTTNIAPITKSNIRKRCISFFSFFVSLSILNPTIELFYNATPIPNCP